MQLDSLVLRITIGELESLANQKGFKLVPMEEIDRPLKAMSKRDIYKLKKDKRTLEPYSLTEAHPACKGSMRGITGDASGIHGYCGNIYGNVSALRGDVSGLEGDVSFISGDATGIYGDATGVFGSVTDLKGKLKDFIAKKG